LHNALLSTDEAGLFNFFRLRAQGKPSQGTLEQLVEKLYAPTQTVRQQAAGELVAIGTPALPLLRAVARDIDPEAATIARHCLKAIEGDGGTLTTAAAHLLVERRLPGAADVLLIYLPAVENDTVRDHLQDAVNSLTYDAKGNADPAVLKALSDSHPLRRVTAVTALTQGGNWAAHHKTLQKLLKDPSASVRWRAALPLAQRDDPEAVSTLIALIADLGEPIGRQVVEAYLGDLAGQLAPKVAFGADVESRQIAGEAWTKWWQSTEKAGLMEEMKKRTISDADRAKLGELVAMLGDKAFAVRQKTETELLRLGQPVLALLRLEAKKGLDLEVLQRLQKIIEVIETGTEKENSLLVTVSRLLAVRRPAGAAETLLAFLPCTDDDALIEQLQRSLIAVAYVNGQPQKALVQALTDKAAVRRSVAVWALCAGGRDGAVAAERPLAAIRPLLKDTDAAVRLKTALALTGVRDPEGVPALIKLVGELPVDVADRAESFLAELAQEDQPKDLPAPDSKEARAQRSMAWAKWWEANRDKVALVDPFNLANTGDASLGSLRNATLLIHPNAVTVLARDGSVRWTVTDLLNPRDAQPLPGERLLVLEDGRVTERDRRGKILWKYESEGGNGAQFGSVQRLKNGNTFIAFQNRIVEVDRSGKEVLNLTPGNIWSARRLPDGKIVAAVNGNGRGMELFQFDAKGQEVGFNSPPNAPFQTPHILANGNAVYPPVQGAIQEFNAAGQPTSTINVNYPGTYVFRLPNGHTLITAQGGAEYAEVDKNGKIVKTTKLKTMTVKVIQP